MNRFAATVAADGWVEHGAARLRVDAARGRARGERVLLLVRPETVDVEPVGDGPQPEGSLVGGVVSHTFLGAVTRIKVDAGAGGLTADVPTARAGGLSIGTHVVARFPAASARLLSLEGEEQPASAGPNPDDR